MKMTEQEIFVDFAEIVAECAGVSVSDVTLESDLADDLDLDSLSIVEVVVSAQDKFGVKIPDAELSHFQTVQDVVSYVGRMQRSDVSA
jgi:acyl carrier protein